MRVLVSSTTKLSKRKKKISWFGLCAYTLNTTVTAGNPHLAINADTQTTLPSPSLFLNFFISSKLVSILFCFVLPILNSEVVSLLNKIFLKVSLCFSFYCPFSGMLHVFWWQLCFSLLKIMVVQFVFWWSADIKKNKKYIILIFF